MTSQVMTTESLRAQRQQAAASANMGVGLLNLEAFELSQRIAKMLSQSTLVPEQYRATVKIKDGKDNYGNWLYREEPNPNGLSNCIIALNMANRMGADPLMIMQNLYLIEGRPSWSSQFVMAAINSCGRFSALRFEIEDLGEKEVEYTETVWQNRQKQTVHKKMTIQNMSCVAFAIERETGERIESSKITMEMAVKEGWYQKNGSKWQTMPEQMLRYRAASFFGRVYAPELLMGLRTQEEELDAIIDITPEPEPVATKTLEDIKPNVVKEAAPQAEEVQVAEVIEPESKAEPAEKKPTSAELKKQFAKALNNAKDLRELTDIALQIYSNEILSDKDRKYLEVNVQQVEQKLTPVEEAPAVEFDETELEVTKFKEQIEAAQTPEALTKIRATFSANGTLSDEQHAELNTALNQKMATLTKPKTVDLTKSQAVASNLTKMISDAATVEVLEKTIAPSINAHASQMTVEHLNQVKSAYAERKTFLENQISMFDDSYYEIAVEKIQSATTEQDVFDITMSPDFAELDKEEQRLLNSMANQKLNEIQQG
ncbi:hypothetical protein [Acinetobacter sp. B51(2017)]|uniref:hypothetical protein n=1 Tax=Acinetobacter sp. B51(2017) TaxID=2060938 RepID=UPI000F075E8B|nr:hypothetical protein [Acinetobacter sp. B51(2017)]